MEETSAFESSEMLANLLASTPLLKESWRLCQLANNANHSTVVGSDPGGKVSFVAEIGGVGYVAFSAGGNQAEAASEYGRCGKLVGLEGCCWDGIRNIFSSILEACSSNRETAEEEEEEEEEGRESGSGNAMVCSDLLRMFWSIYHDPCFRSQISEVVDKCKSIVITGHSVGGAIASLCAIWLLSSLESISLHSSILCITFGSPLLGNESLSRAILTQRWSGNFCHVISSHDIMPRLLFVQQLAPVAPQLHSLLQYWHLSLSAGSFHPLNLTDEAKNNLLHHVIASLQLLVESAAVQGGKMMDSLFWPFGNYLFCSDEGGAICVDNAVSVIKLMYLLLVGLSSASCSIDSHLKYGDVVEKVCCQFLTNKSYLHDELPESSYEAGLALALQSSGIDYRGPTARLGKDCLKLAKRLGRTPSLNCANLAIKLSKVTPYRAEIEWYKESCDRSDDQMGYYDSFKLRGASKRDAKINMNRHKLAKFWDTVIEMLETNQLPHDLHKRAKWVCASQFYKLLVEPLDIAEYYRTGKQRVKGHYIAYGREKRYQVFDKWWKEGMVNQQDKIEKRRSKFASLTQDTLFWARVEEARELLEMARSEMDPRKAFELWERLDVFARFAGGLVERKEVSKDVMAKNSSYCLWMKDYQELKSQVGTQLFFQFPNLMDGEVVP
ncbi:Lipase-like PAD4 [Linum perenne]